MLKESPITVVPDPKAACMHTRSRQLHIKGQPHGILNLKGGRNYMGKHIFRPTDFWIANTQTIQDQRIEDIYQEAGK